MLVISVAPGPLVGATGRSLESRPTRVRRQWPLCLSGPFADRVSLAIGLLWPMALARRSD